MSIVRDGHGVQTAGQTAADAHDKDEVMAAFPARLLLCAVGDRGDGERVTLQDGERAGRGGGEAEEHVLSCGPAKENVSARSDTECVVREHLHRRGRSNGGVEVCEEDRA